MLIRAQVSQNKNVRQILDIGDSEGYLKINTTDQDSIKTARFLVKRGYVEQLIEEENIII